MKEAKSNATQCTVTYCYNLDNETHGWGGPGNIKYRYLTTTRPVGDTTDPSVAVSQALGVARSRLSHVYASSISTVTGVFERCIRVEVHRRFSADGSDIIYQKVQYSRTPFNVARIEYLEQYSHSAATRTSYHYKRINTGMSLYDFGSRMNKLVTWKDNFNEVKAHGYIQLNEGESVRAAAERGLKAYFKEYADILKAKQTTIENNNENWENIKNG